MLRDNASHHGIMIFSQVAAAVRQLSIDSGLRGWCIQGLKVAVVEGHDIGGTCVNRGCVPSKALLAASGRVRELRDKMHLSSLGIQVRPRVRRLLSRIRFRSHGSIAVTGYFWMCEMLSAYAHLQHPFQCTGLVFMYTAPVAPNALHDVRSRL